MRYTESTLTFACEGETLTGVLSCPDTPASTAVVIVVGGPQYRIGSHRQFVLLSRALATAGYAALRFDYRGMGDSTGPLHDFLEVNEDITAAIAAVESRLPTVQRVVLWGLCDGASAALLYCQHARDPRVAGLCLLNPWVRSEASLAKTQVKHYYLDRLRQKAFWQKLLTGQVAHTALRDLLRSIRQMWTTSPPTTTAQHAAPFQDRMAEGWKHFQGSLLLLLSEQDYTAKEFLEYARGASAWKGLLESPRLEQRQLPGADHTLSDTVSRIACEEATVQWLRGLQHPTGGR